MVDSVSGNIHPVFEKILNRGDKETFLKQRAKAIWMTGLSGSGKTTIAIGLERELQKRGFLTQILDGDNIRSGINKNLGFSNSDRKENIRRIAEVSKLFINCGIITINCFVSPTKEIRSVAQELIGNDDFLEIFINTPYSVCEQRDVKGLYAKARKGEIKNFTGLDSPFEEPDAAFLDIKTENMSIEESVNILVEAVIEELKYTN